MDGEEPTQATQNVLDPRRVGKQNSGFSDEDVSDILCILYPHSEPARRELHRLVSENSPHIIGWDEVDDVEPDFDLEDDASRFQANPRKMGNHAIILRLSSQLKNPASGFCFGRNASRCDVVFNNDPLKRISNIHFRIYVNEHGCVMVEDQSTNGTSVDGQLLASNPHAKGRQEPPVVKWVLSSGAIVRIYLHQEASDLSFRVRIPRRDDEYHQAYIAKVDDFFARYSLRRQADVVPAGNGGVPDIFANAALAPPQRPALEQTAAATTNVQTRSPSKRKESRGWTGSGKYNVTGRIGKGAFAVVHKVTSKYDGNPYAAKELEKRRFIKNGVLDQKVENEMKIMKRVHHPHIVKYMEHFEWDDRLLIIIMEYVPNGDLGKFVSEEGQLPEGMVQTVSKQLLSALGYLHQNNITHRDVKPDNILIKSLEPINVKLTDFGLSKMVDSEQTFLRTFCGTLLYCAPEVYTEYAEYDDNGIRSRGKRVRRMPGQRYSHAVDIWSLGGVLFYALTKSPPYPVSSGISYSELLHMIMTTNLNTLPLQQNGVSEQAVDFLCRMLQRRPEYRATVPELEGHPWSGAHPSTIVASQSYDEITDDEDMIGNDTFSQIQAQHFADDRVSDSGGEDERELSTFRQQTQPPRLFGEVGVSAIGSSGVIPEDFLNLQASHQDINESEVLVEDVDEAYQSSDSAAARARNRRVFRHTTTSITQNQSEDQLQSLVEDVASQSLGGDEPAAHVLSVSQYSMQSMEFNTSKRKPPSHDTSDEFDENTPPGKPTMKRLKSEGNMEAMTNDLIEEFKLLARMPPVNRLGSGRQIDGPVNKKIWWQRDPKTWHLNYPEMTQLQADAFSQGARTRGEDFAPGKTPLWDIAMKHFPPSAGTDLSTGRDLLSVQATLRNPVPTVSVDEPVEFPPTAPPDDGSSQIPDTLPQEPPQIVVPIFDDHTPNRVVARLTSQEDSCVQGIEFDVKDTLVSFGRGSENTESYANKMEQRVPKYALKLMLWKDDDSFDPARGAGKPPWNREAEDQGYRFYMSTKASVGIHINGYQLPAWDPKNPGEPSRYWMRVYNGDTILIWGAHEQQRTTLRFNCFWGGSSRERQAGERCECETESRAQKLDAACYRTERRLEELAERKRTNGAADADQDERRQPRFVNRERERTRVFEAKRVEAINFLRSRPAPDSRRASSASVASTTQRGRTLTTQNSRLSPDENGVR